MNGARKTALVTGAAKRIGRAIAIDLARSGWAVAVHYHSSESDAQEVVAEITGAGGAAAAISADLRDEAETASLVDRAAEALGPLSCLINNASLFEYDAAQTVTRASWDAHMEVNLRAPFVLSQAFAKQLPAGARGSIINLIDQRVWNLTPNFFSYTISKSALWTMTRTLALALAPDIRVNGIGPGPALKSKHQTEAQFAHQEQRTPLGRGTTVEEIADAVRFLLGASSVTGQMLALHGGEHLGWAHPPPGELAYD